jgi:tetratricopeptide (TPR) repeat protein
MLKNILRLAAVMTLALAATSPSWADNPGHHPAYLHALSDLRDARAHLQHLSSEGVIDEELRSIDQIDKAIGEIKRAAIEDGKNIEDHVAIDTGLSRSGRLHKALELLDKARHDASGEEDQANTQGLQLRVIAHIDAAHHLVEQAIHRLENGV